MLKETVVAAACALLVLEAMITLQLYELHAASGILAGASLGGLSIVCARAKRKISNRLRPWRRNP
ncbi:hypothetical protein JNB88_29065 [Rhizobium cauense]|uniref:hypothetical protein n=1 Tax=Rhizobium cauense TaxID=1166683 RepID=UPI001C6F5000|nr:hypothetical protein [Rhizobium cauense]MBW9117673.1 hypothetical protein [Rhizobium cauense]